MVEEEWEEIDSSDWVDTEEEVTEKVKEETVEETPTTVISDETSSEAEEWEVIDSGDWVGDVEEQPISATKEVAKAVTRVEKPPTPAPAEIKKGFFAEFFGGDSWGIGLFLVIALLVGITWVAITTNNIGLTGLVIGVLIGFAFQKGRFCIYMAHRDILLTRNYTMMKALVLTLLLIMIGYLIVSDLGLGILSSVTDGKVTSISPRPFIWVAILIGGFIFGVGTVLAGGCAAGTSYRAGEGYVGNMIAVITLMLGASLGMMGVLKPLVGGTVVGAKAKGYLKTFVWQYTTTSGKTIENPTVYDVMADQGFDVWITATGIIILVAIIWIWKSGFKLPEIIPKDGISLERILKRKWAKWKAGVAIALITILGLLFHSWAFSSEYVKAIGAGKSEIDANKIASDFGGHPYSICAACGLLRLTKHYFFTGEGLFEWSGLMMVGLIIGAFISAQFSGEFGLRVPEGKIILQAALGGFLMGLGAVTSLGCTVGHILSGVPTLSLGSLLAWFSIATGIWITTYMLFMKG